MSAKAGRIGRLARPKTDWESEDASQGQFRHRLSVQVSGERVEGEISRLDPSDKLKETAKKGS
jgi:hypothetical protein